MSTITTPISCLIIDDEPLAQDVLATHIGSLPALRLVQKCSNAMEAFEALHKHSIQLIFLDINMPIISGLSFLRSLKDPPAVILTTAYTEHALEGYELDVVDYLLKPISFNRFAKAVKKAAAQLGLAEITVTNVTTNNGLPIAQPTVSSNISAPEKNYFFIKANGKLVKVDHADILYIEGMKDYLKIHTKDQSPIVTHNTMKALEEQLPQDKFIRVHKSYIMAVDAIDSIEGNIIHVGKEEIPLGSSYKDALLAVVGTL
jgi:DNA-binding LytR/AlgR family response regulator